MKRGEYDGGLSGRSIFPERDYGLSDPAVDGPFGGDSSTEAEVLCGGSAGGGLRHGRLFAGMRDPCGTDCEIDNGRIAGADRVWSGGAVSAVGSVDVGGCLRLCRLRAGVGRSRSSRLWGAGPVCCGGFLRTGRRVSLCGTPRRGGAASSCAGLPAGQNGGTDGVVGQRKRSASRRRTGSGDGAGGAAAAAASNVARHFGRGAVAEPGGGSGISLGGGSNVASKAAAVLCGRYFRRNDGRCTNGLDRNLRCAEGRRLCSPVSHAVGDGVYGSLGRACQEGRTAWKFF